MALAMGGYGKAFLGRDISNTLCGSMSMKYNINGTSQ